MKEKTVAATGFLAVLAGGAVVAHSTADLALTRDANSLHHGTLGLLTTDVYQGFEPAFSVLWVLALAGVLWKKRTLIDALSFGLAVATTWLPVVVFKDIFQRPRPHATDLLYPPIVPPADWSYTSGHVAFITAVAVVGYLVVRKPWALGLGVASVLAMSSIVLINGLHYPTDVLASIIWSVCIAPLSWHYCTLAVRRLLGRRTQAVTDPSYGFDQVPI